MEGNPRISLPILLKLSSVSLPTFFPHSSLSVLSLGSNISSLLLHWNLLRPRFNLGQRKAPQWDKGKSIFWHSLFSLLSSPCSSSPANISLTVMWGMNREVSLPVPASLHSDSRKAHSSSHTVALGKLAGKAVESCLLVGWSGRKFWGLLSVPPSLG